MPIDIKRTHYKTNGQGRSLQDIACYAKSGMMSYSLGTPTALTNSPPDCLLPLSRAGLSSPFWRKNKLGVHAPMGLFHSLESLLRKLWDSPRPNKQSTGLFVTSLRRAGLSSPFWRKNKLGYMPPWGYSISLESLLRKLWDSPTWLNKQSTGLFVTGLRRAGLSSPFWRKK